MKKFVLLYDIDVRIHELFEQISREKNIQLLAHETMVDHAHILIGLENHQDLSAAVKMIKGISARRIFQEFPLLKQQIKANNFWARRFGYKEVPEEGLPRVIKYIHDQKKNLHIV